MTVCGGGLWAMVSSYMEFQTPCKCTFYKKTTKDIAGEWINNTNNMYTSGDR